MKILKDVRSYLYNNDYFIDITNLGIHIYNFVKIDTLTNQEIALIFKDFKLRINGKNLSVTKVLASEMMINGQVEGIKIINEKLPQGS